ncbi:unnamed protein product [Phaedon cochleariae]|uniref:VWFA and cache domain-containing protein 1 n=1 Tax=Phaedon cochleariae TaxID=80249 RepID=A0A9P0DFM6_PHACE|nr:unnamed protein product [Phaedon cochleariae]
MDLSEIIYKFVLLGMFSFCAYSDFNIKEIAINISEEIIEMKNNELGVPFIENLYKNFNFFPWNSSVANRVGDISHKFESKIANIFAVIETGKIFINSQLDRRNISSISALTPCIEKMFKIPKNASSDECLSIFHLLEYSEVFLEVSEKIKKIMGSVSPTVKRVYLISNAEIEQSQRTPFHHCIGCDERLVWDQFMRRNNYEHKNVVLILDVGGSISQHQFQIMKSIGKKMLSVLNSNDLIAFFTISSNYSFLESDCARYNDLEVVNSTPGLKYANSSYVLQLSNYIDAIENEVGLTDHVLGFETGLKIIENHMELIKNETVMMLYVSRGLLSSLLEPKQVMEMMRTFTDKNNVSLVINTCAIYEDSKPVMYEPQFLNDIATQNYTKYNISYKSNVHHRKGLMLKVNSEESIPFVVERFYSVFNPSFLFHTGNNISLPNLYDDSKELTMSFTNGWTFNNNFLMLGADMDFSSLLEDFIYYSGNQDHSYIFLMDFDGKIIFHPYYFRSSEESHPSVFVDLEEVEKVIDPNTLKSKLLNENKGVYTTYKINSSDLFQYYWNTVGDNYVVCITVNTKFGPSKKPRKSIWVQNEFMYQNWEDYKLCRHLNLLATKDVSSLYLSPTCFRSPLTASLNMQDKAEALGFIAYLKDDSRILLNPGLKDDVRDEVSLVSYVLNFLQKNHFYSTMSNYIVRRYASSNTGVFQIFPGTVLKPGWISTNSRWFTKAWEHNGNVVFIPPYSDKGGAGYVVTVAYATSELVVAMDITYGYMLKVLVKYLPDCLSENITCFMFDDEGYIIYHPNLMEIGGTKPVEQQHIVHKESLVSNDILNHKHFIRKLLCNSYSDNTIQRYYKLNTSFKDVLVNFVPGEHCVTYRITSVPDTNVFIGIVNTSCNFGSTFCPCSIVDRLCLNCKRMEQNECECPCECPLVMENDICDTKFDKSNMTDNLPCTQHNEESLGNKFIFNTDSNLEPCFPITCYAQKTYLDCLGLLGCQWCLYDADRNYLKDPFCASITTCLNGVFDASEFYLGTLPNSEFSPVGPILGSIIAISVLFLLLFFCYRSYTNHMTERFNLSSTHDQLRMSDLNITDNFHDSGNHRDKLLEEEHPNVISPYCVASTYRRAAIPADSDHGYSTMTPHDESEHLSVAPVEVDSLEDDITSDNTSIHTSISNKESPKVLLPMFTRIPNRNCITVPVTVHRNREIT